MRSARLGIEVCRDVTAAPGFCLFLMLPSGVFVEAIHRIALASPMETLLSLAPGGQAEMTVPALNAGADMALVIAHHVLWISVVILFAPIAVRFFSPKPRG